MAISIQQGTNNQREVLSQAAFERVPEVPQAKDKRLWL
jgi:hypothetical protein